MSLSKKKVLPSGPVNAPYMLIGEAPGEHEDYTGIPFSGRTSEEILWPVLNSHKITRENSYITNLCNYKPLNNNFRHAENSTELNEGIKEIYNYLAFHSPKVIILFGDKAAKYLTGIRADIASYRGFPFQLQGHVGIYSYHPAFIARAGGNWPLFSNDIARAAYIADKGIPTLKTTCIIANDGLQAAIAIEEIKQSKYIAVDIETVKNTFKILCIGIAVSENKAFCFPNPTDSVLRKLEALPCKKIYQNGVFDVQILRENGYRFSLDFDTHIANHVLEPELPRALENLASAYTWMHYWKDKEKSDLYLYNMYDCLATYRIYIKQAEELIERDQYKYFQYKMSLLPVALDISSAGQYVDTEYKQKLESLVLKNIVECNAILAALLDKPINVEAKATLAKVLYDELELPVQVDRVTKKRTTGDRALVALISHCEGKIATYKTQAKIQEYRRKLTILKVIRKTRTFNKLRSSYISIKLSPDGRARGTYKPGGTETTRWSADSYLDKSGLNPQTFPKYVFEEQD